MDGYTTAQLLADEAKVLYGRRLRRVVLFGSWARGEAHEHSDVDVIVVLDRVDRADRAYRSPLHEAATRLFRKVRRPVTVIPVAETELNRPDSFLRTALAEGIEVETRGNA